MKNFFSTFFLLFLFVALFPQVSSADVVPASSRVHFIVNQILDVNQDGFFDKSELSEGQLAKVFGRPDKKLSAETLSRALEDRIGSDMPSLISYVATMLQGERGKFLDTSGVSLLHYSKQLGLTVRDCKVGVDEFKRGLLDYLQNGKKTSQVRYTSDFLKAHQVKDPYTKSNYDEIDIGELKLKLNFDFSRKRIEGRADYAIKRQETNSLVLDIDYLEIEKVEVEVDEIRTGVIYRNAFEWRFEFPEVLNEKTGTATPAPFHFSPENLKSSSA